MPLFRLDMGITSKYKAMAVSLCLIGLWIAVYILDRLFGLMPLLSGVGFGRLQGDWYRLFTGAFLHGNGLHLFFNCMTLFFLGWFLERNMGSDRFLLFVLISLPLSQLVYYGLLPHIDTVFGGSFLCFACMGLLLDLQFFCPTFPRFKLGTWYGNWIVLSGILGNAPLFPFMNITTVILHGVSFAAGAAAGLLFVRRGGVFSA